VLQYFKQPISFTPHFTNPSAAFAPISLPQNDSIIPCPQLYITGGLAVWQYTAVLFMACVSAIFTQPAG